MVLSLVYRSIQRLVHTAVTNFCDVALTVLAAGPIPRHVAFIMDGNRRYARSHHQPAQEGHAQGGIALRRVLEICMLLKVRCVSVYAFAIDNFKRTPEEVDDLMTLLETLLLELCQRGELLDEYGVRLTCPCSAIFNVCMPYGARNEIATAVDLAVEHALSKRQKTITEDDIGAHLMTTRVGSPPLDLLVRTSGVRRLSDFLLWQCCEDTQLQFLNPTWPEFGLWDLVSIILDYQRRAWSAQAA
ncbi:Decaprenyl diphosphate synthase-like protein [Fomitopsis serialis]|uniref:Decaprenyl diphosphate synthase-like protein n=1 Tax=Fomitopsis serialis TaxID=139415 RepID=UPI002007C7F8|nr:Decaprenyl diphosphate synthase-like protein [Neoantrodia serialis]KAH9937002.1 Decaprenyl diphosphate synthase-like protein [Neoantrodia serialis]